MCNKKMQCNLIRCCFNKEGWCTYGAATKYKTPCWRSEPIYDKDDNIICWIEDKTLDDDY